MTNTLCTLLCFLLTFPAAILAAQAEIKDLSINGGIQDGKARLVIDANLTGFSGEKDRLLFATTLQHALQISREKHSHTISATFDILQGEAKELPIKMTGEGEIKKVTGENLQDWSVRQETNGTRSLVLRPRKTEKPLTQITVAILAERELRGWSNPVQPLALAPAQPALFSGYLKVEVAPELDAQPTNSIGLVPIETKFLPESMRTEVKPDEPESLAFRFHGSAYALPLIVTIADPEGRRVVLRDFQLQGRLADQGAAFTLTAIARVKNPRGGSLNLLSGGVALAELERSVDWKLRFQNGQFVIVFDKPGDFPVKLQFNAAVRQSAGWSGVDFRVTPGALAPVTFQGLAAGTQFKFAGAARPERSGDDFKSFLPPDGAVKLSWKESRPEAEGKLFYAAEMLSHITIRPGLIQQYVLFDGKVMQGELSRVTLLVRGQGNVTAVFGANVLAWNVEPGPTPEERRLNVQFNQPQKDSFALNIQMQSELGAFPLAVDVMRLRSLDATRFAGHIRVVNEGAVRLEVVQATGLSQISPEQFPESIALKSVFSSMGNQRFAFRFSSGEYALRVNADNVLPEVSVSQLLAYHLGETELAIDGEFELDIREAPVREVLLRVPKGFAIARLTAAGLSDYFLREPADHPAAELRLVYSQPVADRQVIQLRLERNAALGQPTWALPRIEVMKAKATRGHLAVSADAGFRLTPDRTVALTDIATAFFPRKVAGIQAAFRLTEPAWEATMRVERLPQSIQADVFHLFSIGEGIAYGSSTMNFFISGAPVSAFLVSLSDEYFNVEFTGKDLRNNWQKTTNGYLVTLNTPVSGPYTLLVTYERPFKAQGDTLTFTGARPLDAQSEQGHTLVVSAYQFQVKPANVSAGLLELETAEVPAEYRLFFDAPILKAYRYTARPFNLQLALSPLQQGETLGLVVDRAAFSTRISKDGEVVTDAKYFVKNRGNPHFKLRLPDDTTLWSVTVNGATVVPVKDGNANLIPLPQRADPNAVQTLDLKFASRSKTPSRVTAAVPIVTAPVLLAEWRVEPDTGQRLTYRGGSLAPASGVADVSGFVGLARMFSRSSQAFVPLFMALALVVFAVWAWRWATREGTHRFSVRHIGGTVVGLGAVVMAGVLFATLHDIAARQQQVTPRGLSFLAPVQQSDSALKVEVTNMVDELTFWSAIGQAWPALLALAVWGWALIAARDGLRATGVLVGWTLLAWAVLRWPNGAPMFFTLLIVFLLLHVVLPALRATFRVPPRPTPPADSTPAAVTAALLLGGLLFIALGSSEAASSSNAAFPLTPALSPGEREPCSPLFDDADALGLSSGLFAERRERGDGASDLAVSRERANGLPLPRGEGRGEGEGTAQTSACVPSARSLTFTAALPILRWLHGPAVVGEWMRCSLLQCSPDRSANDFLFPAQPRVPKSQHLDPFAFEFSIARDILGSLLGKPMAAAVEFDVQPRLQTEEIEDVIPKNVLASELISGEATVAQDLPHEFFSPGVVLPQSAGDLRQLPGSHGPRLAVLASGSQACSDDGGFFTLTPALSPGERENGLPPSGERNASGDSDASVSVQPRSGIEVGTVAISRERSNGLPLPRGEGRGEGEQSSRTTDVLLLAQVSPAEVQSKKTGIKQADSSTSTPLSRTKEPAFAESVIQDIRVEEKFALVTAKVRWHAQKDQLLPLLFEPAVLTRVSYPTNALKLVQALVGGKRVHQLLAQQDGSFDIDLQYQLQVVKKDGESGFALPTQHGLVNRLTLTLPDLDVDVSSPNAVSVQRDNALTNTTVATLVLAPIADSWIGWKPRSRDVKREKAVFFAELFQLYVPAAGVVEGVHQVQVRPAQGELGELIFDVPGGATITDVIDPARAGSPVDAKNPKAPGASVISLWRFDPDTRKLRVTLSPPQSRPFTLIVRSQVATGPLPFEQTAGLISVNGSAGQLGSVGVASGNEVQLDSVTAEAFSAINLEDFPAIVLNPLRAQIAGLTLRRAFRYADAKGSIALKASPVEPDVRVETQETLSLGEDRTVLAANVSVAVTRAGIFRISFVLPAGLDVESISGAALSHWTELKAPEGRVITMHLKGKTEGQQQFNVNLAGPGTKAAKAAAIPRLVFREASKQRGQLAIVPEQGMRLQVATRDGVTQLDPQKSGIRQKGVLVFRLLQAQWALALEIEQVDAWVQVTSLQHVTVSEAQVKVAANLQYQIENTGLKALRVSVPTNAEGVRFRGEQVADFLPVAGAVTNDMQTWEVKLHRRIIGKYMLQATWQTPVAEAATNALVRGVQAVDANLQRGFVTVQSGGRLQVQVDAPPAALQPAEWQGIPRALLQDIPTATANFTFRLVEPAFQLALSLERHEATKLLEARVNNVTLTSVISDEGVMLTQVKLELVPGDKRLLNFTLPTDARFWFAFVNQNGVWPWRDQDRILIPLEQQSRADKPTSVELFYSSRIGAPGGRKLDLALVGPKFDLPLENITWQVYLNEKWQLEEWAGTLQLQEEASVAQPVAVDVRSYLDNEQVQNRAKTKVAEEMLSLGNSLLERGNPQQARQAFQSAYGLSTHDSAFNEDARVQLHNLKLQQALVGLNVRQNAAAGEAAPAADNLKQLRNRKDVAYTQQEAKQIIEANTADDNAALMRLAERLIQQQDAAVTAPAAIRAAIPQQGRLLTFRRTVQVDTKADLKISLLTKASRSAPMNVRFGIILAILTGFAFLTWMSAALRNRSKISQAMVG